MSVLAVPWPRPSETVITEAAGGGDVLAEAYRAWSPVVHGVAMRSLRGGQDAEHVTQQVFVEAGRGWDRFDPSSGSTLGWLLGITRRQIAAFRTAHDLPPEPYVEDVAREVLVVVELGRLDEPTRRIIDLALHDGLTQTQIAGLVVLPVATVNRHACHALARLRTAMEVDGDGHHDARPARGRAPEAGVPAR